jgi:transcription elongation factor GreA-like protein
MKHLLYSYLLIHSRSAAWPQKRLYYMIFSLLIAARTIALRSLASRSCWLTSRMMRMTCDPWLPTDDACCPNKITIRGLHRNLGYGHFPRKGEGFLTIHLTTAA